MPFPRLHEDRRHSLKTVGILLLALLMAATVLPEAQAAKWEFSVKFSEAARKDSFTGTVYLIFTRTSREPRMGPSWFAPEQFLSTEVVGWKPGETLTISDADQARLKTYPGPLAEMDLTGSRCQAVARFNPWERDIGQAPGNGYSQTIAITQPGMQPVLEIASIVPSYTFHETKWAKLLKVKSQLLSDFYGHDVFQNAAVILPASYYEQPERRYPAIFTVPGFGGDHYEGSVDEPIAESNPGGVEFIRVLLDPSCPLGHHVFADSASNGPRGRCLIEEFVPAFDKQFRSISQPTARFVTGHSSGGWSSLWIQVTYPEHFGGVWSTAPDPVDFRNFQYINLYQPGENMYVDASGQPRPLARINGQVRLWYRGFAEMEWALGPGGQLHSFEAVFSPRGADGRPLLIWDRQTGAVDTDVAKTWEKYDIRLILERDWQKLEPHLRGRLHVIMGDADTFYLEGATMLLKKSLAELKSDAVVEIVPGRDHFNLLDGPLRQRIRTEMAQSFLKYHPDEARSAE